MLANEIRFRERFEFGRMAVTESALDLGQLL